MLIDGTAVGAKQLGWFLLAVGVAGLTASVLVVVFADQGTHPAARMARCSMGFVVAIVWIMAIADEVVNVLKVRARALLSWRLHIH